MAVFEVQGPDGRVFEVEGPDAAGAAAAFQRYIGPDAAPSAAPEAASTATAAPGNDGREPAAAPSLWQLISGGREA